MDTFNPQQQERVSWPATAVVGRAYLDQLARSNALPPARATAVRSALDRADSLAPKSTRGTESAAQLDALAAQLQTESPAAVADKARVKALAALLKARSAALR